MNSEITAETIEEIFGKHSDSGRFANFCNAVIAAEGSVSPPTLPIFSEKPGADGGIDSEWTIPTEPTSNFTSPFLSSGWNVFQYKARSIVGGGRERAYSNLCSDLKGALKKTSKSSHREEALQPVYTFYKPAAWRRNNGKH